MRCAGIYRRSAKSFLETMRKDRDAEGIHPGAMARVFGF
jgi:hypothetical protein